jgi:hypothetical protein
MHRATDNRVSVIVDRAERKRLLQKSKARIAAVKSNMKIQPPKKAPRNGKKVLLWKTAQQKVALENFHMFNRLKRAQSKSTLDKFV